MTKAEKQNILKWAASLNDEELEHEYYEAAMDSLGSQVEEMCERGYDVVDIREREEHEKYISQKVDVLADLCERRGIKLWEDEYTNFGDRLAAFKKHIPKDFRPWRVDDKSSNYCPERRLFIDTTYYNPSDLGWLDEPMSIYRKYGVYSTREKAIEAAKAFRPDYKIYCEGNLLTEVTI